MNIIGKTVAIIGVLLLMYAFSMDTTVSAGYGYGRVHNFGLMSSQKDYMLLGALLTVVGLGMALSKSKDGREAN